MYNTKIIDMRLRPPFKSFLNTLLYKGFTTPGQMAWRKQMGLTLSPSAAAMDMDMTIAEMDANNISLGVVINRVTDGQNHDELVELLEAYPGRFIGVPHIEPTDTKKALADIDTYIVNGPCSAAYLEPGFRMEKEIMFCDDKRIYPIYEHLEKNNIPLVMQCGGAKNSMEFYPALSIEHIASDFPALKIALIHGGWPQVLPMIHQALRHDNVYLSPDCYLGMPGFADYVLAANTIIQDKMLFGTAYPYYSFEDTIKLYLESGIKADIMPKIFYDNAARFFGIYEGDYVIPDAHASV